MNYDRPININKMLLSRIAKDKINFLKCFDWRKKEERKKRRRKFFLSHHVAWKILSHFPL
jgi:hypothetical protein